MSTQRSISDVIVVVLTTELLYRPGLIISLGTDYSHYARTFSLPTLLYYRSNKG